MSVSTARRRARLNVAHVRLICRAGNSARRRRRRVETRHGSTRPATPDKRTGLHIHQACTRKCIRIYTIYKAHARNEHLRTTMRKMDYVMDVFGGAHKTTATPPLDDDDVAGGPDVAPS